MALEQKIVPLNFAGGLDRLTDPKQSPPTSFLQLENTLFDRPGAANKRHGYDRLGRGIAGTTDRIESGLGLAQRQGEMLLFDPTSAYSYVESSDQWVDKGNVSSAVVSVQDIDTNATENDYDINGATHPDGTQCYVWTRDTATGTEVYLSVVDSGSGQLVRTSTPIYTNGWRPRVVVYGNSFLIYLVDRLEATIQVARLYTGAPLATLNFTQLTGNAANANALENSNTDYQAYDVVVADSPTGGQRSIYLVFNNRTAAGGTTLWWFDASGFTSWAGAVEVTGNEGRRVAVLYDAFRDGPAIAFYDGTTLKYRLYSARLATLRSFGTIATGVSVSVLTGISMSETFVDLRWYYRSAWNASPIYVSRTTDMIATISVMMGVLFSNGSTTTTELARGVRLASKPWVYGGRPYIASVYLAGSGAVLQPTYFVLDGTTGRIVGRLLPGVGSFPSNGASFGSAATYVLPEVTPVGSSGFRFAAGRVLGLGGGVNAVAAAINGSVPFGLSSATLDFADASNSYRTAEAAGSLHLSGGLLQMYDGIGWVEHGFNVYPEGDTISGGLQVTGLSAGTDFTYQYVGVYEWTDNNGNLHRSAPSVPTTVQSSAAISAGNDASVLFPMLRLTQKTTANGRAPVMLAVYRTENNGTVFYRLPYTTSNINDPTQTSVTITDDTEDDDLISGVQLYAPPDGSGEVENVASPPPLALASHRNRLWVVDSTNRLSIAYSKTISPGVPVEFGANFVVNVSPSGGDITSIASMDDKLIVFKANSIYAVTGDGPAANGTGDDLSTSMVTTDCGCINQRSIGMTPDGLMFQSAKGIKLLTRALAVVDIGAPVTDLATAACTSAVQLADKDQLRLTFDDKTALSFDYFVGQWSQFTSVDAADSIIWNGQHTYLRSDGLVMRQNPDSFRDAGSFIRMKIRTAWLSFAGLQGYQRVYRVLLLGTYKAPHKLWVDVAYDFDPTIRQTLEVTPTPATTYGSGSPYGSDSVYGGTFAPYQWRINLTRQKCQSIQLTIRDSQASGSGESCTLSGMTAVVGVIPGSNRMPATQSVG